MRRVRLVASYTPGKGSDLEYAVEALGDALQEPNRLREILALGAVVWLRGGRLHHNAAGEPCFLGLFGQVDALDDPGSRIPWSESQAVSSQIEAPAASSRREQKAASSIGRPLAGQSAGRRVKVTAVRQPAGELAAGKPEDGLKVRHEVRGIAPDAESPQSKNKDVDIDSESFFDFVFGGCSSPSLQAERVGTGPKSEGDDPSA